MTAISGEKQRIVLTATRVKQIRDELAFLKNRLDVLQNNKNKNVTGELVENIDGIPKQNIDNLKKEIFAKERMLIDNVERPDLSTEKKNKLLARHKWLGEKISQHISSIQEDEITRKDTQGMIKAVEHCKYEMVDREYRSWVQEYKRIAVIINPNDPTLSNLILLKPSKRAI